WRPFDQERPGRESAALIGLLLRQAGAFDRFLSPCLQVRTRLDITEEEKELWKKTGLEAGARKVRFVPRLQESGTALVIQTGYAGTELGLFAGGRLVKSQYILFGGRAMDEDIQQLVARRTRCLLHLEDARALRLSASQALWKGANPLLEVSGLNRYGEYETVQIRAAALWPGMKPVIDQIVSWTGSLLEAASMEARELFMKEGLSLR
ncbi:rod shape-determining protein, partial [Faecalibaculum rodentium]